MRPYFTRERFGRPQFLAGMLLLAFFAQCAWLVRAELTESSDLDAAEAIRIREGWKQWHGRGVAGAPFAEVAATEQQNPFVAQAQGYDPEHSPLLSLASAAPLIAWPKHLDPDSAA